MTNDTLTLDIPTLSLVGRDGDDELGAVRSKWGRFHYFEEELKVSGHEHGLDVSSNRYNHQHQNLVTPIHCSRLRIGNFPNKAIL